MRWAKNLVLAVGVAALCGCQTDTLTAPRPTPKAAAKTCATQLYSDPTNCSDPGSGGYTYTNIDGAGSAAVVMTFQSLEPPKGVGPAFPVKCPTFFKALVPATLFQSGQAPLTVISTGYFIPQTPNITPGRATYTWPSGWWAGIDGSGREANIKTAEAVCFLRQVSPYVYSITVNFYNFHGQIRQNTASSSGGGGGGGSVSCETEFVTVEIDNGAGWQAWWSGNASVCT
jgi:hypothetical protein